MKTKIIHCIIRTLIWGSIITIIIYSTCGCSVINNLEHENNLLWERTFHAKVDSINRRHRYDKYFLSSTPGRYYILNECKNTYNVGDTILLRLDVKAKLKIKIK